MSLAAVLRYLLPRPDDEDEWLLRLAIERQEKKQSECRHPPEAKAFSVIAGRFYCRICEVWLK